MKRIYLVKVTLIIFVVFFECFFIFLTHQINNEDNLYVTVRRLQPNRKGFSVITREKEVDLACFKYPAHFCSLSFDYLKPTISNLQKKHKSSDLYYYLTKSSKSPPA